MLPGTERVSKYGDAKGYKEAVIQNVYAYAYAMRGNSELGDHVRIKKR